MLKSVHIRNFKSIRDCFFEFKDLQVLVGANGSGKSSFLQALDVVGRALRHELEFDEAFHRTYRWRGASDDEPVSWKFCFRDGATYELSVTGEIGVEVATNDGAVFYQTNYPGNGSKVDVRDDSLRRQFIGNKAHYFRVAQDSSSKFLAGMRRYHLDPSKLAASSPVAHKDRPLMQYDGSGIATVLDYLLASERRVFTKIEETLKKFVPRFQELLLRPGEIQGSRILGIRDVDGWEFLGSELSGGLLLFLGYLVLVYAEQASLLLLEEPENGIHPRRLEELVEMTRHLTTAGEAQVVMASHSPYLVDYVDKNEVFVVTRSAETGETSIHPLLGLNGAAKRADDYYAGELVFNFSESDLTR